MDDLSKTFLGAPPKERGAPLILWFGGGGGGGEGGEDISFFEEYIEHNKCKNPLGVPL